MGILCACLPVCWPLIARRSSIIKPYASILTRGRLGSWWEEHKPKVSWSWGSGSKGTTGKSTKDGELDIEALALDEYCVPPSPENEPPEALLVTGTPRQIWVDKHVEVDVQYAPGPGDRDSSVMVGRSTGSPSYQWHCERAD